MEASLSYTIVSILGVIYLITVVGVIFTILLENRDPIRTAAWVSIVGLVPILGLLAYTIFGQNIRRLSLIHRRYYSRVLRLPNSLRPQSSSAEVDIDAHYHPLITLLQNSTSSTVYPLEQMQILTDGAQYYAQLFEDLRQATEHIHMEVYIFDGAELMDRLEEILVERVQAGVAVRIIYDYLGSYGVDERRWLRWREQGIQVYPFMKVALPLLSTTVNYRNHRKVSVIDGRVGYFGGMNMAQKYLDGDSLGRWRDTHFRLEGAGVYGLQSCFLADWYSVCRRVVPLERYFAHSAVQIGHEHRHSYIQYILGGPISRYRSTEQAMTTMISRAKRRISIQTPYFIPTQSLWEALISASLSGIEVELMIPYRSDSRITTAASNSYLERLLKAGVRIYRYYDGFLHSKLMMVDDEVCLIGSANMDFRSLEHNFEISGIVYDSAQTHRLREIFDMDKHACKPMSLEQWQKRSRRKRMIESLARLLSPAL